MRAAAQRARAAGAACRRRVVPRDGRPGDAERGRRRAAKLRHAPRATPADGVVVGSGADRRPAGRDRSRRISRCMAAASASSAAPRRSARCRSPSPAACRWSCCWTAAGTASRTARTARHFAHANGMFHDFARASGWIPMVALMLGAGFAGPTNYAGLADFVVMVRGLSTMGLAGPALVKAATGEEIDNMALGGAEVQVDRAGPRRSRRRRRGRRVRCGAALPVVPAGQCPRAARRIAASDAAGRPRSTMPCSTWCRPRRARSTTCARCWR